MRKNLGDPKSAADLDEIPEDHEFSKLWKKEHPSEHDNDDEDVDDDYDKETIEHDGGTSQVKYGYTPFANEATKYKYSSGPKIAKKMGYYGVALGSSGKGFFLVPNVNPGDLHDKGGVGAPKKSKSKTVKGGTIAEEPVQLVSTQTSIPQPHTTRHKRSSLQKS